jgi:hypothetical protein
MTFICSARESWIIDMEANSVEEAIEKAKQIDPQVDTAEPKLK